MVELDSVWDGILELILARIPIKLIPHHYPHISEPNRLAIVIEDWTCQISQSWRAEWTIPQQVRGGEDVTLLRILLATFFCWASRPQVGWAKAYFLAWLITIPRTEVWVPTSSWPTNLLAFPAKVPCASFFFLNRYHMSMVHLVRGVQHRAGHLDLVSLILEISVTIYKPVHGNWNMITPVPILLSIWWT